MWCFGSQCRICYSPAEDWGELYAVSLWAFLTNIFSPSSVKFEIISEGWDEGIHHFKTLTRLAYLLLKSNFHRIRILDKWITHAIIIFLSYSLLPYLDNETSAFNAVYPALTCVSFQPACSLIFILNEIFKNVKVTESGFYWESGQWPIYRHDKIEWERHEASFTCDHEISIIGYRSLRNLFCIL